RGVVVMTAETSEKKSATTEPGTEAQPGATKRDDFGRFAKGTKGGPGNPHARESARMLLRFRDAIPDDRMDEIFAKVLDMAVAGDMNAIKLVFTYRIGKPVAAPDPDRLDHDEWRNMTQAAVSSDELHKVFSTM